MEITICPKEHKRCYTQKDAGDVLRIAKGSHNRKNWIPKRSYYCAACGYYHLTSTSNNGDNQRHQPIKILNAQEDFDLSEIL